MSVSNRDRLRYDETARLILMDLQESKKMSIMAFSKLMREEDPAIQIQTIAGLWEEYNGFDLRSPSRDIETGELLSVLNSRQRRG